MTHIGIKTTFAIHRKAVGTFPLLLATHTELTSSVFPMTRATSTLQRSRHFIKRVRSCNKEAFCLDARRYESTVIIKQ